MRWKRSAGGDGGVEDLRGSGGGLRGPAAIGGGLGGLGLVGVIVAIVVVFLGRGRRGLQPGRGPRRAGRATPAATGQDIDATGPDSDNTKAFVVFVVNDVQNSWQEQFARAGETYPQTTLRLFTGRVPTGCGAASAEAGPFYCPADRRVYLDMAFFRELSARFGAPGDFAQAYVIAHEFGHHVQNVLGILPQVTREMQQNPVPGQRALGEAGAPGRLPGRRVGPLGLRAQPARGRRPEEGLAAATAVGDDRIQTQAGGRIDPDTFTHGTSEQRTRWFLVGFRTARSPPAHLPGGAPLAADRAQHQHRAGRVVDQVVGEAAQGEPLGQVAVGGADQQVHRVCRAAQLHTSAAG